jgi:hypothetical protein
MKRSAQTKHDSKEGRLDPLKKGIQIARIRLQSGDETPYGTRLLQPGQVADLYM